MSSMLDYHNPNVKQRMYCTLMTCDLDWRCTLMTHEWVVHVCERNLHCLKRYQMVAYVLPTHVLYNSSKKVSNYAYGKPLA